MVKEGEVVLAELWPVGGKPAPQRRQSLGREKEHVTSFSTGPQSAPTHWKQTVFMLRDPITVSEGMVPPNFESSLNALFILTQVPLSVEFSCARRARPTQGSWMLRSITL